MKGSFRSVFEGVKIGIDNKRGFFGPPKAFILDNEIGVSFTGNSQESREFII